MAKCALIVLANNRVYFAAFKQDTENITMWFALQ